MVVLSLIMADKFTLLVTLSLLVISVSGQQAVKGGSTPGYVEEEFRPTPPNVECVHRQNRKGPCLIIGVKTYTSSVVFDGEEHKYAIPFLVRDGEFNFKLKPDQGVDYITLIQVKNLLKPEHQGYVILTDGGVGDQKVTLFFKSLRGEGYHFHIKIFADSRMQPQQQKQIQMSATEHFIVDTIQKEYQIPEIEKKISNSFIPIQKEQIIPEDPLIREKNISSYSGNFVRNKTQE